MNYFKIIDSDKTGYYMLFDRISNFVFDVINLIENDKNEITSIDIELRNGSNSGKKISIKPNIKSDIFEMRALNEGHYTFKKLGQKRFNEILEFEINLFQKSKSNNNL